MSPQRIAPGTAPQKMQKTDRKSIKRNGPFSPEKVQEQEENIFFEK